MSETAQGSGMWCAFTPQMAYEVWRDSERDEAEGETRWHMLAAEINIRLQNMNPPAAAPPEPGAVEVLNELAAAAQEYGNSGSTNSMRRLFAARERADDLLTLRTATPRADATAGVSVDLSDLSRDQLETAYKRLRQASDAALLFFNRYKKPPLSAPSCLRCGRQTTVYAVQHLEIPSVVLCPACAPHATAGGVTEAMVEAAARAMVASVHFGYGDDRWDDIADWLRHKWMSSAREILTAALRAAQPETSGGEVPSSQTEEPTPPAIRRCNRHDDCDAADAKARAQGRAFAEHCHDDCCEECFGY